MGIDYQQKQNGKLSVQAGAATILILPVPLLPRLSCPWRATAATAVVRSAMLVTAATVGAVRLAAPIRATSTSSAAMPTWAATPEQAGSLCVALRIDTLIHLII